MLDIFVSGKPASFAMAGERPWKSTMTEQIRSISPDPNDRYLDLDFVVQAKVGYREGADIDNLCEPVMSVPVNGLGWFGGRRPTIAAVRARKRVGSATGCHIRTTSDVWLERGGSDKPIFAGTATLPLPRSARDLDFGGWVTASMGPMQSPHGPLRVRLQFRDLVNLGDIATGRVKSVIACLYPVIGGRLGAPDDSRIHELETWREVSSVNGTVRVEVTTLSSD